MSEEILNIEYHTKLLLLKALNTKPTTKLAAYALGISERQLYNLKRQYGIAHNAVNNHYFLTPNNMHYVTQNFNANAGRI